MASVEIRHVSKSFGATPIINDVSVAVDDGTFLVLVGPSGCGKSTLLRMLAGLEPVSDGQILIGGAPVNHIPAKDRDIAMVFQSYALYPHMTVAENMGFSLRLRGVSKPEVETRVGKAAAILNLADYLGRYPRELSGGQRQRVAMGRAIVRDPKVFLFDEPLSNLDAKLRVQMRKEIRELHQRLGNTMVYVTHDQVEAMTMADKIAVLRAGRIEQVGAPLELYEKPANTFVAQFIGSPAMNLLVGRLENRRFVGPDKVSISVPTRPETQKREGRSVLLGIRPEHFQLCAAEHAEAMVRVTLVEHTGSETLLSGLIGDESIQVLAREIPGSLANAGTTSRMEIRAGDELGVRTAQVHLFDPASGLRLEE
jgi:multiple sugar transport system ATP-binding protein